MKNETQIILQKHPALNQHFKYQNTRKKTKILNNVLFSFFNVYSQITQKKIEQLADLLLKYPKVYAAYEFDAGKVNSPLSLPLKPDAIFKKQRASKVPIHLQDKVNQ